MKVLFINEVCGIGSTGKICIELAKQYEKDGHEVKIGYGRHEYVPDRYQKYAVRIGSRLGVHLHAVKTRLTDKHGLGSRLATMQFLKWAEEYSPDMLWLHNVHGYYINYEMLFKWIKKHPEMEVKWTLHDCWAFTGHCSHFTFVKCYKWKTQCENCEQKRRYPVSYIDNSKNNFIRKKAAFTGVKNMTVITPSQWLADLVKESFLNEYPVEVVHNTIDTNVFKPTPSDFREKHGLTGKKIILGVASVWDERKGFGDFLKLAEMLDDNFRIVLVGLNNQQMASLPENIIGIKNTSSRVELAEIYTAADVLLSLSKEETFGMTVLEAQSCGTHTIVYQGTACEEVVRMNNELGCDIQQDINEVYRHLIEKYR